MSAPQSAAELQASADEALAEFRRGAVEIKKRGDLAKQAIAEATGEATSRDGAVTVDVTFDGSVRALRFSPTIASLTPDTLAAEVMATIRAATAQALGRAKAGVVAALGEDNEAVAVIDRRLAQADPTAAAEPAAPSAPAAPSGDDWQGRG